MHQKNPHGKKCIAMTVISPFKHGLPFHGFDFEPKMLGCKGTAKYYLEYP